MLDENEGARVDWFAERVLVGLFLFEEVFDLLGKKSILIAHLQKHLLVEKNYYGDYVNLLVELFQENSL